MNSNTGERSNPLSSEEINRILVNNTRIGEECIQEAENNILAGLQRAKEMKRYHREIGTDGYLNGRERHSQRFLATVPYAVWVRLPPCIRDDNKEYMKWLKSHQEFWVVDKW